MVNIWILPIFAQWQDLVQGFFGFRVIPKPQMQAAKIEQ